MTELSIRRARAGDVADLTALLMCPGVQRFTTRMPFTGEDWVRKRVEGAYPNLYALVGEVAGRVVTWATLERGIERRAHVGSIGMSVHDAFWGRGIGRQILAALLDIADNWLGLRRVELEVNADNARAIGLYEKAGFETEGRLRGNVLRDGVLVDTLVMGRLKEPAPWMESRG